MSEVEPCNAYCRPDEGVHCVVVNTWDDAVQPKPPETPDDWSRTLTREYDEIIQWDIAREPPSQPAPAPVNGRPFRLTASYLIWYRPVGGQHRR